MTNVKAQIPNECQIIKYIVYAKKFLNFKLG